MLPGLAVVLRASRWPNKNGPFLWLHSGFLLRKMFKAYFPLFLVDDFIYQLD